MSTAMITSARNGQAETKNIMAIALSETTNTPYQRADPHGRLVLHSDCLPQRLYLTFGGDGVSGYATIR